MDFQLDDLLKDDKKDANLIPDLSKASCDSPEEFRRLLEHCPEFKIKAEKVKKEEVKVRDKDFSWKPTKKELRGMEEEWPYGDPVPPDMRSLNLRELQQVAIDWRMLTPIRPKLRQDEEMFSRMVEMGKLEAKTLAKERRSMGSPIRRSKNRAGIIESSVKICSECAEEFCFGESCGDVSYESFIRVTITTHRPKIKVSADTEAIIANMDREKGKKSGRKGRTKRRRIKSKAKSARNAGKARKSSTLQADVNSNKKKNSETVNNVEEDEQKTTKRFKRKCAKYTKKYHV